MGTADLIHAPHRQNQIRSCIGGIHIRGSIPDRTEAVAFIDILKKNRRRHGAGDIHVVQNQIDHRLGIIPGAFSQINAELSGG